jgi:hypothetical protein
MTDSHAAEPSNVDVFTLIAATIFRQLYEAFPIPSAVHAPALAEDALGVNKFWRPQAASAGGAVEETREAKRYLTIAQQSIAWLETCGLVIHLPDHGPNRDSYVLSPAGFAALAASPSGTDAAPSLGKLLAATMQSGTGPASEAGVTGIVGRIIGAAGRSFA